MVFKAMSLFNLDNFANLILVFYITKFRTNTYTFYTKGTGYQQNKKQQKCSV